MVFFVLQVEHVILFLQLSFVDGGTDLPVVEDGHADADTGSEIEIRLQLGSPAIVAHGGGVRDDATVGTDGRHTACLGHLHAEVATLHAQHGILNLRTMGEGSVVNALEGWYGLKAISSVVSGMTTSKGSSSVS